MKLFLRRIANIFVPLIPALIGCGIIAGLNGLLTNAGWLPALVPALTAIASGFMSLIAVFVGYNTAKEFGGTPVLGGAVAAVIVFPGIANVTAFGQKLAPGQGGVLGALGAALLAAQLEKQLRRRVPESLDVLLTPTLTVLLTGLVTVFGLMYVAGEVSTAIGTAADWLLAHGGAVAGFLLGALFLPLVMLGLHQALIPIHTTLIEQQGYTTLLPILAMAGAGQVGAAMAVYVRLRRNHSIRATIRSALPAGFLGVGEPLIYGVSLPLGRPFITACLGGAFGGGFVGLFNQLGDAVGSTAIGPSGWALFPLVKGNQSFGTTLAVYALGLLIGYAVGFVATYFFGLSRQQRTDLNRQHPDLAAPDTAATSPGADASTPKTGTNTARPGPKRTPPRPEHTQPRRTPHRPTPHRPDVSRRRPTTGDDGRRRCARQGTTTKEAQPCDLRGLIPHRGRLLHTRRLTPRHPHTGAPHTEAAHPHQTHPTRTTPPARPPPHSPQSHTPKKPGPPAAGPAHPHSPESATPPEPAAPRHQPRPGASPASGTARSPDSAAPPESAPPPAPPAPPAPPDPSPPPESTACARPAGSVRQTRRRPST
ncbi:PTS beta-glucoside transporter subunit EIIBCA [Streptomyces noursei]|uniref:PTS beta-glucoside transporter subunit EIIBCA n=1 Tax=Streptomyces noursei TaxID=1971 RepID=A0A401R5P2_STRNR|nr:PTS beta-glucoside transporter subunit EIIBCA [Streptomyces noursei]